MEKLTDIENYILQIDERFQISDTENPLSNKKLQKVIFYLQAWSIKNQNRKLVNTRFEKWPFGPISRESFFHYKDYLSEPLTIQNAFEPIDMDHPNRMTNYISAKNEGLEDFTKKVLAIPVDVLINHTAFMPSQVEYHKQILDMTTPTLFMTDDEFAYEFVDFPGLQFIYDYGLKPYDEIRHNFRELEGA